jgi:hypothetical protein
MNVDPSQPAERMYHQVIHPSRSAAEDNLH